MSHLPTSLTQGLSPSLSRGHPLKRRILQFFSHSPCAPPPPSSSPPLLPTSITTYSHARLSPHYLVQRPIQDRPKPPPAASFPPFPDFSPPADPLSSARNKQPTFDKVHPTPIFFLSVRFSPPPKCNPLAHTFVRGYPDRLPNLPSLLSAFYQRTLPSPSPPPLHPKTRLLTLQPPTTSHTPLTTAHPPRTSSVRNFITPSTLFHTNPLTSPLRFAKPPPRPFLQRPATSQTSERPFQSHCVELSTASPPPQHSSRCFSFSLSLSLRPPAVHSSLFTPRIKDPTVHSPRVENCSPYTPPQGPSD